MRPTFTTRASVCFSKHPLKSLPLLSTAQARSSSHASLRTLSSGLYTALRDFGENHSPQITKCKSAQRQRPALATEPPFSTKSRTGTACALCKDTEMKPSTRHAWWSWGPCSLSGETLAEERNFCQLPPLAVLNSPGSEFRVYSLRCCWAVARRFITRPFDVGGVVPTSLT